MKKRMSLGKVQTKSLSLPITWLLATAAMVLMRISWKLGQTLTAALM